MQASKRQGAFFAVLLAAGLVFLLIIRLIPFRFVWQGDVPFYRLVLAPLNIVDIPTNILFVLPFGFGLAALLSCAGWPHRAILAGTVFIGTLLSVALEFIQLFMPDRAPSLADVITNAAGLVLAYGLFRAWEYGWVRAIGRYVTPRNVAIALAVYGLAAAFLTFVLLRRARLDIWSPLYPLIVGNEADGSRPWEGQVRDIFLLDRAISDSEVAGVFAGTLPPDLIARYPLVGNGPYVDTMGVLPVLEWQAGEPEPVNGEGIAVGSGRWVMTAESVAPFVARTAKTDAFTIGLVVAPARSPQFGPARIVSISPDPYRRNLTLGQKRDALSIRLRTLSTGENGNMPELLLSGALDETAPRRIVLTYDRPVVRVYLNNPLESGAMSLAPGIAFFNDFPGQYLFGVSLGGNPYRYDRYYALIVIGIGAFLGGVAVPVGVIARRRLA